MKQIAISQRNTVVHSYLSFSALDVWRAISLLLALLLSTLLWFAFLPYHTFMGDDLRLLILAKNGEYANSFWLSLSQVMFNKYRPVLTALLSLEIAAFGENFRPYIYFNM